jgi:hypothetical protein
MTTNEETTGAAHDRRAASETAASALDLSGVDGPEMADLLDRLPGALERIERGIEDVREGRTIPLNDL